MNIAQRSPATSYTSNISPVTFLGESVWGKAGGGQWLIYVVKHGDQGQSGLSGQAIKLFQLTPYVKHSTIPVPDSL